ncbi:MAG: dockerin type I domain-containing protein [Candidatus Faecisoma sp.]|nr:dockerin type I domain-containing protein [Acholeplasma sp.]MDY2893204.1 dockerin type I domain-containing protein [Candidatus Faecisoma sp.]
MNKKGFTLIEMLAIIILLSVIALITYPIINNVVSDSKDEIYDKQISELVRLSNTWVTKNMDSLEIKNGYKYYLSFNELFEQGFVSKEDIINPKTGENLLGCMVVTYNSLTDGFDVEYDESCIKQGEFVEGSDNSGANKPELFDNMLPVYYDSYFKVWKKANSKNLKTTVTYNVGDANFDGVVDSNDINFLKNASNYNKVADTISQLAVDVDGDGVITESDLNLIKTTKYYNKKVDDINETRTALVSDYKWYDYDSKMWANAVTVTDSTREKYLNAELGTTINIDDITTMWVWIPRYKYTIFNGNNGSASEQLINVTFESGVSRTGTVSCVDNFERAGISEICSDTTNKDIKNNVSTYTHPAFKFGNTELTGFWVGKFEVSGSTSAVTIKPNVTNLRKSVSVLFSSIKGMKNTYGITNADSHMIKNMEWGAVAYLKQSKYGLGTTSMGTNNNSNNITGCGSEAGSSSSTKCNTYDTAIGQKSSTTGNIYGVYDMSGGGWDYTMGNMKNENNGFYSSNAGFTSIPDTKYYDSYKYDASLANTHTRGKLGDATKETLTVFGDSTKGWENKGVYAYLPESTRSWFARGGRYDTLRYGIFSYGRNDGSGGTSRAVLSFQ